MFSTTIPTNQEFTGQPVTPTDTHCHIIPLPVLALPPRMSEDMMWLMFTSLVDQFQQHLNLWQHPLFGPITKCQPMLTMHSICLAHGLLSLVSNALVQKNKQSGFAWVITHKDSMVWKGVGLAPGHAEDMYSGCAEVFGLWQDSSSCDPISPTTVHPTTPEHDSNAFAIIRVSFQTSTLC